MANHPERGGMPRHDAVGVNSKYGETTDFKTQVPSIWIKGCMLDNCKCVTRLDMTTSL